MGDKSPLIALCSRACQADLHVLKETALFCKRQGDFEEAAFLLEKAEPMASSPDEFVAISCERAMVLREKGEPDNALSMANSALVKLEKMLKKRESTNITSGAISALAGDRDIVHAAFDRRSRER